MLPIAERNGIISDKFLNRTLDEFVIFCAYRFPDTNSSPEFAGAQDRTRVAIKLTYRRESRRRTAVYSAV